MKLENGSGILFQASLQPSPCLNYKSIIYVSERRRGRSMWRIFNQTSLSVQTFVYNSILLTGLEFHCIVWDFVCPWHWLLIDFNVIWNCVQKFVLLRLFSTLTQPYRKVHDANSCILCGKSRGRMANPRDKCGCISMTFCASCTKDDE